ncbi:hypothetical protein DMENIID0001_100130 [Sergentomyia squamirostris]
MPHMREDLWATFVIAKQTNCRITHIDPTAALKIPGVVAFYKASHIPGTNSFVTTKHLHIVEDEEIFASSQIRYHAQPIGMIVAESFETAQLAPKKVRVTYERSTSNNRIYTSVQQVIDANDEEN